jgi:hypothetical protein
MAAGCKVCGMPHTTSAHQKILRTGGGYTGGSVSSVAPPNRVPDRVEEFQGRNQTRFVASTYLERQYNPDGSPVQSEDNTSVYKTRFDRLEPVYPEPQNVLNMPRQLAGYTDDFNTAGQPANLEGVRQLAGGALERVMFDKDQLFVIPWYKKDFDNVGNDPDSSEYVSNYRGPKSIRQMENLKAVGAGVQQFADAAGKYYGKKVTVMKNPYDYKKVPKSVRNENIFVHGDTKDNSENPYFAGVYNYLFGTDPIRTQRVARFKEDRGEVEKVVSNSGENFTLNTNLHPRYDSQQKPYWWAHVAQHEYGHALGFNHPKGYDDFGQQNSIMSYDYHVRKGGKLGPVDINAIQDTYAQAAYERDVARRAAQNRLSKTKRPKRK